MNRFGILLFVAFIATCFAGVWWGFVLFIRQIRYWKNCYLDKGSEGGVLMRELWKARFAFFGFWIGGVLIGALGFWLGDWPIDQQ